MNLDLIYTHSRTKTYTCKCNNMMWFLRLSSGNARNLWTVVGIVVVVIAVMTILRKLQLRLRLRIQESSLDRDPEKEVCDISTSCDDGNVRVRAYCLEELRNVTRDFRIQIGVGATSLVYLAELGDGRFGAVKRVMEERGGSKEVFLDEVSVLLRVSHPNLVALFGFCLEKGEQLLLLEYVPNKSLFDRMHTPRGQTYGGTLQWSHRLSIALDIARALDYLHSLSIIHRDVKSSNILLLSDHHRRHAKLSDFGLSCLSNLIPDDNKVKGSLGYVDTNYLATGIVSAKSDVYSFGVLLLELVTGLKSMQGSVSLAEWTRERRISCDSEVLVGLLDPQLDAGETNLAQLRVVVDIANLALLENSEARPDMGQIVDRIVDSMDPAQLLPQLPV